MLGRQLPRNSVSIVSLMMILQACGGDTIEEADFSQGCVDLDTLSFITTNEGTGYAFLPDPISTATRSSVQPGDSEVEAARIEVPLSNLDGHGILRGSYVNVVNGLTCSAGYSAYSPNNRFFYSRDEPAFQETMSYFHGDQFRQFLDESRSIASSSPFLLDAYCENNDNAYYIRTSFFEFVCMGVSRVTDGAAYADDGYVTVHELQHAASANTYHPAYSLGNLYGYDEGGSLSEAISDFMALIFFEDQLGPDEDPRVFSRWALGSFFGDFSAKRGAHRCPIYSEGYPDCTNYGSSYDGFSAQNDWVSFNYPDGLGWPYADNYPSALVLKAIFDEYRSQESIHANSVILSGALWDSYQALRALGSREVEQLKRDFTYLVHKSIELLPKPSFNNASPVTFIGFAENMVQMASFLEFSEEEIETLQSALRSRGLYDFPALSENWAEVGPGSRKNPGIKIEDDPTILTSWGLGSLIDPKISQAINGRLSAGEVAALWFDVRNTDLHTAGAVQVDVRSKNESVYFLDSSVNGGALSPDRVQIQYYKINGTGIVNNLDPDEEFGVATSNTYFETNPYFDRYWTIAIFLVVDDAFEGNEVEFEVTLRPANGPEQVLTFTASVD